MKLGEIINRLKQIYTELIGVEYMHIWDHEQVNWIREQIETKDSVVFTKEEKLRMLDRLCWSDHFEAFLAKEVRDGEALRPRGLRDPYRRDEGIDR